MIAFRARGKPMFEPFLSFLKHHQPSPFTTESTHSKPSLTTPATATLTGPSPVNSTHLLKVCIILYQQQESPDTRLHKNLHACNFNLTHEFFLQVCNTFPSSWRPVYRFFQYTQTHPNFTHTSISFNKLVDVVAKSRNIELFWDLLMEMGRRGLVNDKTFRIALKNLAEVRELKKCVEFFHLMNGYGWGYSLRSLNIVVETLCRCKLVAEAKFVVLKLKECIKPDEITYGWLIKGFCRVGDMIEASKVWNMMVDEGFEPGIDAVEEMTKTLFKTKRYHEALNLFEAMKSKRKDGFGLSTYRLAIKWLSQVGKINQAHSLFEEMLERGIQVDNPTLASIICGLLARGRSREAYNIMEGIENPDVSIYHGLIKGLLKLRRAREATQVFREMIKRGCEPTMHTYIMLLQGHLGKKGRKGMDPNINFDSIFVGGLVRAGKTLEATKFVERIMQRGVEVPRFDYNKFLHYFSNEEGVVMFEEVGKKLREAGLVDLADIFERYGRKMATRDRRRDRAIEP